MSLEPLVGATYGPYDLSISAEKVAEYVTATGDVDDRWLRYAPPSFAGALLFVVAPHFLADPRVSPFTGVLVHVDQTFVWHQPLAIGQAISITGRVDKVRARGGAFFVSFVATVDTDDGIRLVDAVATFLMGESSGEVDDQVLIEPAVGYRASSEPPVAQGPPEEGATLTALDKSASRLDLVKYAAASGDYNPIHFDHDAAVGAGLGGTVVHGLMMAAWASQVAGGLSTRPDPIAAMKLRFRSALRPGAPATVGGTVGEIDPDANTCKTALHVTSETTKLVTASCVARLDR